MSVFLGRLRPPSRNGLIHQLSGRYPPCGRGRPRNGTKASNSKKSRASDELDAWCRKRAICDLRCYAEEDSRCSCALDETSLIRCFSPSGAPSAARDTSCTARACSGRTIHVLPGSRAALPRVAVDCFGRRIEPRSGALLMRGHRAALKSFAAQRSARAISCPAIRRAASSRRVAGCQRRRAVSACVLEDPPFFRVTPVEMQQEPGCSWKDGFMVTHAFLRQRDVPTRPCTTRSTATCSACSEDCSLKIAVDGAERSANRRASHAGLVPHDWVRGLYFYDDFDVRFSETFYDGTWFDGIDQADLLRANPSCRVPWKAKTNYGEDIHCSPPT